MKKIWTIRRYDTCQHCNTPRSIECYDEYDKPIRYSFLLDKIINNQDISNTVNSRAFTVMRCTKCGTTYCIDWTEGFPKPLTDLNGLDWFLFNFYTNNNIL